jgi:hypothetical protein
MQSYFFPTNKRNPPISTIGSPMRTPMNVRDISAPNTTKASPIVFLSARTISAIKSKKPTINANNVFVI